MAGEAENTGGTAPKTRRTALNREEQDRKITAESAGALALMDGVLGDAEIAAILAAKGYPAGRFAEGRALQSTLQTAIAARQGALGAKTAGANGLEQADAAARERYADFRGTARPVFPNAADRTALNLNGNVSRNRQQFITAARTSYDNAKNAVYQNVLTNYGETAAALDAALAGLAALEQADGAQNRATGDAERATKQRDDAHKALKAWTSQLRAITRNALKKRPDLLAKLGL